MCADPLSTYSVSSGLDVDVETQVEVAGRMAAARMPQLSIGISRTITVMWSSGTPRAAKRVTISR